jgi:hypothetical protein
MCPRSVLRLVLAGAVMGSPQLELPMTAVQQPEPLTDPEEYAVYAAVLPRLWAMVPKDALVLQRETEAHRHPCPGSDREWEPVEKRYEMENGRVRLLQPLLPEVRLISRAETSWRVAYAVVSAVGFNQDKTKAIVYVGLRDRGAALYFKLEDGKWVARGPECGWVGQPNFSGTWRLLSSQGAISEAPDVITTWQAMAWTNIRGEPSLPHFSELRVERHFVTGVRKEAFSMDMLAMDSSFAAGRGGLASSRSAKWDGDSLVIETGQLSAAATGEMHRDSLHREVWRLDPHDPQQDSLIITVTEEQSGAAPSTATLTYNRSDFRKK